MLLLTPEFHEPFARRMQNVLRCREVNANLVSAEGWIRVKARTGHAGETVIHDEVFCELHVIHAKVRQDFADVTKNEVTALMVNGSKARAFQIVDENFAFFCVGGPELLVVATW